MTSGGVAVGTYTLTARATDDLGATTTSAPSTITVAGNTSPTVAITRGSSPSSFRLYAMLPAVPPYSRRISGVRKQTLRMCS